MENKKIKKVIKIIFSFAVIFLIVFSIILLERMKIKNKNKENAKLKDGKYPKAPELVGVQQWINSKPLKIEDLKGKVVLIDFWTYTCINCIRTLPYLKEWDKKYRDKGLVIVGVHTPEFDFEKKYDNVVNAVKKYGIEYPVVQDNSYATWNAYENRYWPHKYLIDADGFIRYEHIGEGSYDETEKVIQELLKERMETLKKKQELGNMTKLNATLPEFQNLGTPEIYFGYGFTRGNFGNTEGIKPEQVVDYKLPVSVTQNKVYLDGKWKSNKDNMELVGDDGGIMLVYKAKSVNIVAGSDNSSIIYVFFDTNFLTDKNKGKDIVFDGDKSIATAKDFKLYSIIDGQDYNTHVINIDVVGRGFKIYTFTFG